jgi:hypothetical protein
MSILRIPQNHLHNFKTTLYASCVYLMNQPVSDVGYQMSVVFACDEFVV